MPSNIINKRAILLTGTIIPNSIYTSYNNSEVRLTEYLNAITFYANQYKNDDIYFLENSEFDLENNLRFLALKNEIKITLFKYNKSEQFNEGKGYQEFEMLDSTIENLKDKYSSFIKITGRYIVTNCFDITNFQCDSIIIDVNKKSKKADTYFMYFTTDFYLKYIKGEYKQVKDHQGIFIEHVIYTKIINHNLFNKIRFFSKTPLLEGTTGSYGISLKRHPLRVFFRNCERFVYRFFSVHYFPR